MWPLTQPFASELSLTVDNFRQYLNNPVGEDDLRRLHDIIVAGSAGTINPDWEDFRVRLLYYLTLFIQYANANFSSGGSGGFNGIYTPGAGMFDFYQTGVDEVVYLPTAASVTWWSDPGVTSTGWWRYNGGPAVKVADAGQTFAIPLTLVDLVPTAGTGLHLDLYDVTGVPVNTKAYLNSNDGSFTGDGPIPWRWLANLQVVDVNGVLVDK